MDRSVPFRGTLVIEPMLNFKGVLTVFTVMQDGTGCLTKPVMAQKHFPL